MNKKIIISGFLSLVFTMAVMVPAASAFWPFDGLFDKGEVKSLTTQDMLEIGELTFEENQKVQDARKIQPNKTDFSYKNYSNEVKRAVVSSVNLYNAYTKEISTPASSKKGLLRDMRIMPSTKPAANNTNKLVQIYKLQLTIEGWTARFKNNLVSLYVQSQPAHKTSEIDGLKAEIDAMRKKLNESESKLVSLIASDTQTAEVRIGTPSGTPRTGPICAGIANRKCPAGYRCQMDKGNGPDASGTCVRDGRIMKSL